jgi:hypothetical protein
MSKKKRCFQAIFAVFKVFDSSLGSIKRKAARNLI